MNWLLDTNVVSEGTRRHRNPKVVNWLQDQSAGSVFISVVSIAELRHGAATALEPSRRALLEEWIDTDVTSMFRDTTVPLTIDILMDWMALAKRLRASGVTRDAADTLIASTARVHGLTVVTRDVRDFAATGVVVYDPWNDQTHRMKTS